MEWARWQVVQIISRGEGEYRPGTGLCQGRPESKPTDAIWLPKSGFEIVS
jgi:hypothetical protein